MRLFVAVELTPGVTAAATALVGRLRRRAAEAAPDAHITWITPDRMHVTVRFIGHVADERAEAIVEALGPAIGVAPFTMTLGGLGTFPGKGPPRVLWAGIVTGGDQLERVEEIVSLRLAAIGVPREDRPFHPHLTLARVREARGLRARSVFESTADRPLGDVPVDAITLFESRMSATGPAYRVRHRTVLV